MVNVHYSGDTSLSAHTPNTAEQYLSRTNINTIFIFLSNVLLRNLLILLSLLISALESENVKSIGKRGRRRVSDFQPQHQWTSLNSSTQYNPQPVGKCEKLHKVIYTLMAIFPKNNNGIQFKDTTVTSSLFSKIIARGLYWVLYLLFFSLNKWHAQNRQVTSGQMAGLLLSKQALQTNLKL